MENREYAKLTWFVAICKKIGIKPTKRQASKHRMKKGSVYKAQKH